MSSPTDEQLPGGPGVDPIKIVESEQVHLKDLCDTLEAIADGFPGATTPSVARSAAEILRDELPRLHCHEEKILYPLLLQRVLPEDNIEEILAGFGLEHAMDEGYAEEVLALLDQLAAGMEMANAEMAGYLLRGFFESLRRHLRWEGIIILRLARQRLTDEDLARMSVQMLKECS
jgi:hypothetical protein